MVRLANHQALRLTAASVAAVLAAAIQVVVIHSAAVTQVVVIHLAVVILVADILVVVTQAAVDNYNIQLSQVLVF